MRSLWVRFFRSREGLLFWGSVLLFASLAKGYISVSDAQARYEVARQIYYEGSIFLPADSTVAMFWDEEGRAVSPYGLGQSISMLPSVVVADVLSRFVGESRREWVQHRGAQFLFMLGFLPFLSGLCVLGVHSLARRAGLDGQVQFWVAIAFGFGTFWLYYTRTVGQNLEVAALCLASLCVFVRGPKTALRTAGATFFLGWTLLYRPEFLIPVVLALIAYAIQRHREERIDFRFLVGLLGPVFVFGCLVLTHNYFRSGHILEIFPDSNDYMFADKREAGSTDQNAPLLATYPGRYLFASMFGINKGFFWYSPVMWLAFFALIPGFGRWPRALTLGALPIAGQVLFVSSLSWAIYEGGWGPRYLFPITPFLVLGGAMVLAPALEHRRVRIAMATFVVCACVVQMVLVTEDHWVTLAQVQTAEAIAVEDPALEFEEWQASLLLARLRNLQVRVFDPPEWATAWDDPRIASIPPPLKQEIWWLKLGEELSAALAPVLKVIGVALALGGLAGLALSFRRPSGPLGHGEVALA